MDSWQRKQLRPINATRIPQIMKLTIPVTRQTLAVIALALLASSCSSAPPPDTASDWPLLELRKYTTHPNKLDDLHRRFSDHTMALFKKHGIKNLGYWTPVETPDTLIYLIGHKSRTAAEASWKAFIEDPQWRSAYEASQADGPLVSKIESTFMQATDYSPGS